jgi:hypothetical protein
MKPNLPANSSHKSILSLIERHRAIPLSTQEQPYATASAPPAVVMPGAGKKPAPLQVLKSKIPALVSLPPVPTPAVIKNSETKEKNQKSQKSTAARKKRAEKVVDIRDESDDEESDGEPGSLKEFIASEDEEDENPVVRDYYNRRREHLVLREPDDDEEEEEEDEAGSFDAGDLDEDAVGKREALLFKNAGPIYYDNRGMVELVGSSDDELDSDDSEFIDSDDAEAEEKSSKSVPSDDEDAVSDDDARLDEDELEVIVRKDAPRTTKAEIKDLRRDLAENVKVRAGTPPRATQTSHQSEAPFDYLTSFARAERESEEAHSTAAANEPDSLEELVPVVGVTQELEAAHQRDQLLTPNGQVVPPPVYDVTEVVRHLRFILEVEANAFAQQQVSKGVQSALNHGDKSLTSTMGQKLQVFLSTMTNEKRLLELMS